MTQHSGLTLAYLGDAVYELLIRKHLIAQGQTKVDNLHQLAVAYTNAEGQAQAYFKVEPFLSEEERNIYKRGRNAKSDRKAKSASLTEYRQATGLEALFGELYLTNQHERIDELMSIIVKK